MTRTARYSRIFVICLFDGRLNHKGNIMVLVGIGVECFLTNFLPHCNCIAS